MFGGTTADNHNPMKVCALPPVGIAVLLLCFNASQQDLINHIEIVESQGTVFKVGSFS